jgi:hypothetical protein
MGNLPLLARPVYGPTAQMLGRAKQRIFLSSTACQISIKTVHPIATGRFFEGFFVRLVAHVSARLSLQPLIIR